MRPEDDSRSHRPHEGRWTKIGGVVGILSLLVGVLALLVSLGVGPKAAELNLTGTWNGDVDGDDRVYSLSVTIRDDGTTAMATATYPDIPCKGTWTQQSRTPTGISFLEDMPDGVVCFDDVPVHVELEDGTLTFTAESGGRSLDAELRRIEG